MKERMATGNSTLDGMLGGGLVPGTMTVIVGATGIGKTQLGVQFAGHGLQAEQQRGIFFDMTSRGDSQNHLDYAERLEGWELRPFPMDRSLDPHNVWRPETARYDYLHLFQRSGRRVTISDLDFDDWKEWKVELSRKLDKAIAFFYGNFIHGVRRCVIDGIEPVEKASDSFQFHVFDYVYHQILHKESDWVARDLLRVHYRENADRVADLAYDHQQIACLLLLTSHEVLLDDLLARRLETGDVLSNANTIIFMGKVRDGLQMRRALHVAKHRGSACDDGIRPFEVTDRGLVIET